MTIDIPDYFKENRHGAPLYDRYKICRVHAAPNEELINLLEPIYAHDCDGRKLDLLSEALLTLENILLSKNEEELKNHSGIEAIAYLALAEAMKEKHGTDI